ncbi:hypothetical protein OIU77_007159 [Salix suchowensis]|uniref:DUF7788 domain-containing protein n=1 Tax=Salix suchowensis TaxID=1278906 RepID=A0ABQ9AFC2_9ROSI|nr:hypothetical protein OIU77_007159 [Salix suchowensis]
MSDIILQVAVNGKLRLYLTIKRLFVFSDMGFDQASTSTWEQAIKGLAAWHFLCPKAEFFGRAVSLYDLACSWACLAPE